MAMGHDRTSLEQKRVVIADDDRDLVRALAARCRALGLDVYTAHDALAALVRIHQCRPALVCVDVNMPCGNGLCVCEMLVTDPTLARTPMIVLTGDADHETIRRCHRLCAFYVEKCRDVWPRIEPLVRELLNLGAEHGRQARASAPLYRERDL